MKIIIFGIIIYFFTCHNVFSFDDEFSDYNKDIYGEPRAKTSNIYNAWSNNMAYHIERKAKEGIVVDKQSDNSKYNVDSFGNVTIKDNAIVTAPIVVQEDYRNTTIVQKRH